jgi:hypothetical protein
MAKNTINDVFKHINMHKGDKNVCWEWKGKINKKDGRPYFTVKGNKSPAYAVALRAYKGEPSSDLDKPMARHSCDNRICCNPHHLDWGSHQTNMDDMVERERHGLPKTVVRNIGKLLKEGRTHKAIAILYGTSREAITSINKRLKLEEEMKDE